MVAIPQIQKSQGYYGDLDKPVLFAAILESLSSATTKGRCRRSLLNGHWTYSQVVWWRLNYGSNIYNEKYLGIIGKTPAYYNLLNSACRNRYCYGCTQVKKPRSVTLLNHPPPPLLHHHHHFFSPRNKKESLSMLVLCLWLWSSEVLASTFFIYLFIYTLRYLRGYI